MKYLGQKEKQLYMWRVCVRKVGRLGSSPVTTLFVKATTSGKAAAKVRDHLWGSHPLSNHVIEADKQWECGWDEDETHEVRSKSW